MQITSKSQRRARTLSLWSPETLESRALLSASKCDVMHPVAAEGSSISAADGRQAVPRVINVAGNDYSLSSDQLGNGSLVITQSGLNIHGVFTASKVQSSSFDASFKNDKAHVAKGTLDALFIGDSNPVQAKFRVKFKPESDGSTSYTFNHLKFHPAPN
jgi:hypothetical protein